MVHLIHYELKGNRPRFQYEELAAAIRNISGTYCHTPESTWLVETELSTIAVRNILAPFTVVGDPLFVIRVHDDWAAFSLSPEQVSWLKERNFNSVSATLTGLLPPPVPSLMTLSRLLGSK